ncbi:hypothetical protein P8X24_08640 [Pyrococcus kukulkanii]|uniref:hypothetical protein n=1 Tax=Pyrococcus kukulkanii TaxID=1609559 RepID=UPI003568A82A
MKRFESPLGDNIGGIDVNSDRVNLAIVNRSGELLDKVLGYLKYYWIRNGGRYGGNYNYKVATFRNSVIERIAYKAPLYGLRVVFVNPARTSTGTEELQRKLGLDRHAASAYIIALKALKRTK